MTWKDKLMLVVSVLFLYGVWKITTIEYMIAVLIGMILGVMINSLRV